METDSPIKRTITEPERTYNPFTKSPERVFIPMKPVYPGATPDRDVPAPAAPERERETVPA